MSKVYLALQDNEQSHYIVEAIEEDNPDVTVIYQPAMIRIEKEGSMVIKRETIEEHMGREFDLHELQLHLITMSGHLDETDDEFALSWDR